MNLRNHFLTTALGSALVILLTGCGGANGANESGSLGNDQLLLLGPIDPPILVEPPTPIEPPTPVVPPALVITFKSVDYADELYFKTPVLPTPITPVANRGPIPGPSPSAMISGWEFSGARLQTYMNLTTAGEKKCLALAQHAKENGLSFSIAAVGFLIDGGGVLSSPPVSEEPGGDGGSAPSDPGLPPAVDPGSPTEPGMPAPPVFPPAIKLYQFTTILGCTID